MRIVFFRQQIRLDAFTAERIAVLEALVRLLPSQHEATSELVDDVRRFFAETGVILEIKTDGNGLPIIVPLEEPFFKVQL